MMKKIQHVCCRTPSGVRGLKYQSVIQYFKFDESHPVRGAWIEIDINVFFEQVLTSHPVRGAWIEIPYVGIEDNVEGSHPVRGAWIEIT